MNYWFLHRTILLRVFWIPAGYTLTFRFRSLEKKLFRVSNLLYRFHIIVMIPCVLSNFHNTVFISIHWFIVFVLTCDTNYCNRSRPNLMNQWIQQNPLYTILIWQRDRFRIRKKHGGVFSNARVRAKSHVKHAWLGREAHARSHWHWVLDAYFAYTRNASG